MHLLIGDIQGCLPALEELLLRWDFSVSRHRLTVLGDLVNRGPASAATVRRLMGMGTSAQALLGNHDLHLLAVAHGVRPAQGGDTLGDILGASDREEMLRWLAQRPLALQEHGWLCVHAGVAPSWSAADTLANAAQVEAQLRGPGLVDFLGQMYGNEPSRWDDALQGAARLRCIVNTLTRIRWCTPNGTMDFQAKEGQVRAPEGLMAWFDLPERRTTGTPLAFGHWSTLGLIDRPDLLALDTGCVWGGSLTGVRIDGGRREVVQVRCEAKLPWHAEAWGSGLTQQS
jgi:bis(5'-nucleosyl)-tetraphosphatase (symmetrical)